MPCGQGPLSCSLIERECAIKLHVRSVGTYLKRWGFTPQNPSDGPTSSRLRQSRSGSTKPTLEIKQRAKQEDAEIHWGDETAVVNTDVRGGGYAPKGETPVAYVVGGTRQKLSMISSVTNRGNTSWMIIDGNFNHERLIEFFQALIQQAGHNVGLVLDSLGVHHYKQSGNGRASTVKRSKSFTCQATRRNSIPTNGSMDNRHPCSIAPKERYLR